MQKNCCVPGCVESGDSHPVLHRFPDPDKYAARFRSWVMAVGGDILSLNNKYICDNRRVCHRHFERKYCYPSKRLSRFAVPSKTLSEISTMHPFTFGGQRHVMRLIPNIGEHLPSLSKDGYSLFGPEFAVEHQLSQPSSSIDNKENEFINDHAYVRKQHYDHMYCKQRSALVSLKVMHQEPIADNAVNIDHNLPKIRHHKDHSYYKLQVVEKHPRIDMSDDGSSCSAPTYTSMLQISKKKYERPEGNHLSPSTRQHHSEIQLLTDSTPSVTDNQTQRSIDAPQMPSDETQLSIDESQLSLFGVGSLVETEEVIEETLFGVGSLVETEEVIEETVVFDNNDYGHEDFLSAGEPSPEKGPFSWQRSSVPVPCDTETDDGVLDLKEDAEVFMYDDGDALAKCEDAAREAKTEQVEHHYKCNSCDTLISGPRYTCVQCADYDVCGACDARGAHSLHYVLRVPQHRPHSELQAVLQTIRRVLLSDGVIQLDGTQIKSEVKEEPAADPIGVEPAAGGGGAGGGDARGAAEDASDTELESQAQTDTDVESQAQTDTEEDVTDDDASWAPRSPASPRTSPRRPHTRITKLNVQDRDAVMLQVFMPETTTQTPMLPIAFDRTQKRVESPFSIRRYGIKRTMISAETPDKAKVRVLNQSEVNVDEARVVVQSRAGRGAGPSDSRALEHARLVKPAGTVIKVTNLVKQAHVNVTRLREEQIHSATHKS